MLLAANSQEYWRTANPPPLKIQAGANAKNISGFVTRFLRQSGADLVNYKAAPDSVNNGMSGPRHCELRGLAAPDHVNREMSGARPCQLRSLAAPDLGNYATLIIKKIGVAQFPGKRG